MYMRLYLCQAHYQHTERYSGLTSKLLSGVELSFFDECVLQQMVVGSVIGGIYLSHADD